MRERKERLYARADIAGLAIGESSPGDGMTRFRFFRQGEPSSEVPGVRRSYYGDGDIFTACGLREAFDFVTAYILGQESKREPDWSKARRVGEPVTK